MSCVKDHPDRMTILQLGEIIKIMYKHCLERGKGLIEVKFQHRVISVGQDKGKAWAEVEVGEEKKKVKFEAEYVIGCDGATSAVRRSLFGREWPGQTFDYQFIVQNVGSSNPLQRTYLIKCRYSTMASKNTAGMEATTWSILTTGD